MQYPYDVHYINSELEGQPVKMAFMDAKPSKPNGEVVILFHGKNFNGFYSLMKLTDPINWSFKPNFSNCIL